MGSPPEAYRFKPGQIANPGGKPKTPEDIREARKISQFEFERIVNRYLFIPPTEIKKDLERTDATAFEHLLGGIIQKAITKKDERKAEWLLARTLGKMRERLEVESKSLKVSVQATAGAFPSLEQLAIENPDLTPGQLQSVAEKFAAIRTALRDTRDFSNTIEALPLEISANEGPKETEAVPTEPQTP